MRSERIQVILALVELKFVECLFCVRHCFKHFVCAISLNIQSNLMSVTYQSWSQNEKIKWGNEESLMKDALIKVWPAFRKSQTILKCHEESNSGEP